MHTLKKSKTLKDHNHVSSMNGDKSHSLNSSITIHAKKITFSHNSKIIQLNDVRKVQHHEIMRLKHNQW